jgi:hypothetical protein
VFLLARSRRLSTTRLFGLLPPVRRDTEIGPAGAGR